MVDLDTHSILQGLELDGYFICDIKGSSDMYNSAREEYRQACISREIYSSAKKFSLSELFNQKQITKYAIGPENGSKEPIAQFLITTYLANIKKIYPIISTISEQLVSVRNILTNVRIDFGNVPERDSFWNAIRLHHYPLGGGFMQKHIDTGFPAALAKSGVPYLQASCCLSVKGTDFNGGGGYVISKRTGEKIYTDTEKDIIRFIFFDGSVQHGVDVPGKTEALDIDGERGRVALFTNLYKYTEES